MSLLRIAEQRWSVLVAEQVLSELSDWGSAKEPKLAMVSLLTRSVPEHGPQHGTPLCKHLEDQLFEFCKGEHVGPKVRVLWFYGTEDRRIVVCVRAFVKSFEKTPVKELEAARQARFSYRNAVHSGTLQVEEGSDLIRRKR